MCCAPLLCETCRKRRIVEIEEPAEEEQHFDQGGHEEEIEDEAHMSVDEDSDPDPCLNHGSRRGL